MTADGDYLRLQPTGDHPRLNVQQFLMHSRPRF